MSRKSNLAQTSVIACALSLLLSSTAWAAVVNIHVTVPVIHPKVPVVIVKPNVPHIANTTGSAIGSQSSGAGAGKVNFNNPRVITKVETAAPGLLKDATSETIKGTHALNCKVCGVTGASGGGNKSETIGSNKSKTIGVTLNPLGPGGDIDHPIVSGGTVPTGSVTLSNSTVDGTIPTGSVTGGAVPTTGPVTISNSTVGAGPAGSNVPSGAGPLGDKVLINEGTATAGGNVPVNVGEVSVGGGAISAK